MSNLQTFNQKITDPRTQNYLRQVLGEKRSSFVTNLTALVANNKNLQECEPLSVMYAGIKAMTGRSRKKEETPVSEARAFRRE